jgi:hypothetical protein
MKTVWQKRKAAGLSSDLRHAVLEKVMAIVKAIER